MSRSYSFFKEEQVLLGAHINAENFSSDEEEGIEVSAVFSKRESSNNGDKNNLFLSTHHQEREEKYALPFKSIDQSTHDAYAFISSVKNKPQDQKKKSRKETWKSECACAIL